MSDRQNRDVGQKRVKQKYYYRCDCWLCTDGATKKRIKKKRQERKELLKSYE